MSELVATRTEQLRARSAAFGLLARMLGPDTASLTNPQMIDALRIAFGAAAAARAADRVADIDVAHVEAAVLAGRWVRWFELGRVAPYEGSNVASNAGGVTPRLADVAGFYRAFGLAVVDERPDHVVAQIEFLAMALLAEAEAIEVGDAEAAEAASRSIRLFLRDHIGSWIDGWAARVGAIGELEPWFPYAAAVAELVRAEASRRNVIPLSDAAVLPADAGVPDDEEGRLSCEDELV